MTPSLCAPWLGLKETIGFESAWTCADCPSVHVLLKIQFEEAQFEKNNLLF